MPRLTASELIKRNGIYAETAKAIPNTSEIEDFEPPRIMIFCCVDFRLDPEGFLGINKGEAFVFRNVGGNVKPYLNDVLFLDTFLRNKLEEIIIIHHADCGTTHVAVDDIKDNLKRRLPSKSVEIGEMHFQMHDGKEIEKSVREDLRFLRECEYIRTELAERSKGFIFNLKTNRLEPVDY
ncbi:hypothetical protein N7513_000252 [Penicillium frequentans]|nr:hypothetical protein N7513_000252 [Penicillium glabrum]